MYKYTSQSKTKEPSAIREEAFRLHEVRKAYTRMSGQHVIRMLQFRSMLEHCLVESFSAATLAHFHDVDGGKQVWSKLDAGLNSWKQWLIDVSFYLSYIIIIIVVIIVDERLGLISKDYENSYLSMVSL